jgi:hypothetical protein
LLLSACWDTFGARWVYVLASIMSLLGLIAAQLSYRWQDEEAQA